MESALSKRFAELVRNTERSPLLCKYFDELDAHWNVVEGKSEKHLASICGAVLVTELINAYLFDLSPKYLFDSENGGFKAEDIDSWYKEELLPTLDDIIYLKRPETARELLDKAYEIISILGRARSEELGEQLEFDFYEQIDDLREYVGKPFDYIGEKGNVSAQIRFVVNNELIEGHWSFKHIMAPKYAIEERPEAKFETTEESELQYLTEIE